MKYNDKKYDGSVRCNLNRKTIERALLTNTPFTNYTLAPRTHKHNHSLRIQNIFYGKMLFPSHENGLLSKFMHKCTQHSANFQAIFFNIFNQFRYDIN
jgi:hypothetical protein